MISLLHTWLFLSKLNIQPTFLTFSGCPASSSSWGSQRTLLICPLLYGLHNQRAMWRVWLKIFKSLCNDFCLLSWKWLRQKLAYARWTGQVPAGHCLLACLTSMVLQSVVHPRTCVVSLAQYWENYVRFPPYILLSHQKPCIHLQMTTLMDSLPHQGKMKILHLELLLKNDVPLHSPPFAFQG